MLPEVGDRDVPHPEFSRHLHLLGADVDPLRLVVATMLEPPHQAPRSAAGVEDPGLAVVRQQPRPIRVIDPAPDRELVQRGLALSAPDVGGVVAPVKPALEGGAVFRGRHERSPYWRAVHARYLP